jgi:polyhydroxyalkanoate synthesis regulator phasin
MSNSSEKMRVLDLLEAGKINAEEAAQLISSLGAETREPSNAEEKLRQFAQDCNKFAKDVGCKMQELYKDVEPKIKKASQSALEKAADALDNLACSINESLEKSSDDDDSPKEN